MQVDRVGVGGEVADAPDLGIAYQGVLGDVVVPVQRAFGDSAQQGFDRNVGGHVHLLVQRHIARGQFGGQPLDGRQSVGIWPGLPWSVSSTTRNCITWPVVSGLARSASSIGRSPKGESGPRFSSVISSPGLNCGEVHDHIGAFGGSQQQLIERERLVGQQAAFGADLVNAKSWSNFSTRKRELAPFSKRKR